MRHPRNQAEARRHLNRDSAHRAVIGALGGTTFETWWTTPLAHAFHCYCDGPTNTLASQGVALQRVVTVFQPIQAIGLLVDPVLEAALCARERWHGARR